MHPISAALKSSLGGSQCSSPTVPPFPATPAVIPSNLVSVQRCVEKVKDLSERCCQQFTTQGIDICRARSDFDRLVREHSEQNVTKLDVQKKVEKLQANLASQSSKLSQMCGYIVCPTTLVPQGPCTSSAGSLSTSSASSSSESSRTPLQIPKGVLSDNLEVLDGAERCLSCAVDSLRNEMAYRTLSKRGAKSPVPVKSPPPPQQQTAHRVIGIKPKKASSSSSSEKRKIHLIYKSSSSSSSSDERPPRPNTRKSTPQKIHHPFSSKEGTSTSSTSKAPMSTQGGKGILHPSTSPAPTATAETQSPSPEMLLGTCDLLLSTATELPVLCASLKATAEQLIEEQRQLVHSGAEKIGAIDALKSDVEQLEKLEQSLDSELKWTTLRLSLLTVPTSQHSDILAVLSDLDLCNLTADFQSTLRKVQLGQAKVMLCRESTPSVVADGPSNKCLVCWERPKQVFLDPCGHTLCQMCSGILKICPACRAPIERCQPLFL